MLIHPPAARTTEAPLGIARLAGFLRLRGVRVKALDLCAEGLAWLLSDEFAGTQPVAGDTWTRRALKNRERNCDALRSASLYANSERHSRAVRDLNRALHSLSAPGTELSLADYRDEALSPLRRTDLLTAATDYHANIFHPFFRRRLEAVSAEFPTLLVGISVNYLSQALCAFALAGLIKAEYPGWKIVLGGGLINSWLSQGCLSAGETFNGLFDAILGGRGEESLASFLELDPCASVPPDFDDFEAVPYFAPTKIIPYNFSVGCPWKRCTFCPEKAEDARYRGIPVADGLAEIAALVSRYDPGLLHLTDNEIGPAYLRALSEASPGPPWYGFSRFSSELTDPAFCRRLAASGCRMLQLGLESGDQAVLDALGKGTKVEEIAIILENLKAAGIGTFIYVLFGTPSENRDAALVTRDFVALHSACIDFLNVAVFNMPATSEEAAALQTRPFYEGDLSLYREFEHPSGWNRDGVRSFLARDFEAEPRIKGILLRNPPVFTSNHAAFLLNP